MTRRAGDSRIREGGYAEVLTLALPLILSTSSWAVQHFVDRMFLAWYSPQAIAAAMPAGMLNFTLMSFFVGTAGYVSTFVAQYDGAGMHHRVGPVTWQGLYVSVVGGLVLLAMVPPADVIFAMVGHEEAVRANEVVYFRYLCAGSFPAIASAALSGLFTGLGRTVTVMWITVSATALNLVLDYGMIFGRIGLPEMGIKGAALATVASGVFSMASYASLMSFGALRKRYAVLEGWRFDPELFKRLVRFGAPSGIQFFLDMAGFACFVLIVGRLGTVSLAATNIAFNINTIAFMPMIGVGIAVSVLVGRYIGGGRPDVAQRSTYAGFAITSAYMITVAALYVFFPSIFTAPFAHGSQAELFPQIENLTKTLLRFVAVYSVFDTMNVVFSSALKGAGDTRFVMIAIVLLSAGVLVVPTFVMIAVLGMGVLAAWVTATAYVSLLGLVFYMRFLAGKWRSMKVIERPCARGHIATVLPECPDSAIEP
ncbi:MAG TPA: MATE family efflux transporter [Deltaproteobacteria bacterium]|nr:MATE family efflux transporter [Deltaproteobacteria bacterium]